MGVARAVSRVGPRTELGAPDRRREPLSRERQEAREFNRIVALSLVLFIALALVSRLAGRHWEPWPEQAVKRGSLLAEARQAAESYVARSFLGW